MEIADQFYDFVSLKLKEKKQDQGFDHDVHGGVEMARGDGTTSPSLSSFENAQPVPWSDHIASK